MKKIYLASIFAFLFTAMNAQTSFKVNKKISHSSVNKPISRLTSPNAISAVITCTDSYAPGSTQDLHLILTLTNNDNDFGDLLEITLPAGFTLNTAAPDFLGQDTPGSGCPDADGGTKEPYIPGGGQVVTWGNNDDCVGGLPTESRANKPMEIVLNVTIDASVSGKQTFPFYVSSSSFDTDFNGDFKLEQCVVPSISSVSNNSPICSNQSLKLGSSLSGTSPFTYTWSGTGSFSAANSASTTVTGSETGNYVLNVTNACGTASASVSALVELTPTLTVNSESICYGKTATLTVSGADTYVWSSGETTSSIIVTPTASVNQYTVTGTALNSCQNKVISSVSVNALPNVNVNSEKICVGQTATLSASGATSYIWSSSETTSDIIVTPSASVNQYTVTGTDGNNCQNTSVASVTVNSLPVVSLSTTSLGVQCDDVTNLTLTGGAPLGGIYSGNAVTAGVFNPSSAGVGTHTITYIYTDANNCSNSASDNVQVDNCTGIESANADFFKVYPNPTTGTLIISMTENMSSFELFNLVGEKVLSNKLAKGNNYIDLSHLSKGAYFVKINTTNKTVTKKVVLSK